MMRVFIADLLHMLRFLKTFCLLINKNYLNKLIKYFLFPPNIYLLRNKDSLIIN